MAREFGEPLKVCGRQVFRFVRVRSHSGVIQSCCSAKGIARIQLLGPRSRPNRKQGSDASRASPLEHSLAILRKLREINMRVRVNQFHLK